MLHQCDARGMVEPIPHKLELLQQSLMSGKLPRNLGWDETLELIGHLGQVQSHGTDEFTFSVGTQRAFFKKPHGHELGVEEVARLRSFLRSAGSAFEGVVPSQPCRMVVVIDHHGAHVYQDFNHAKPDRGTTVHPHDPFGFHHHLLHRKEAHYKGEHVPEDESFYNEIAGQLAPADEIVLIGHGTGKSSAVNFLAAYLEQHHHAIALRVIGIEAADLSALTGPELETIAKRHMIAIV